MLKCSFSRCLCKFHDQGNFYFRIVMCYHWRFFPHLLDSVPHLAGSHLDWRSFCPSALDWEILDVALQYDSSQSSGAGIFRGYTQSFSPFPRHFPASFVAHDPHLQQAAIPPLPVFSTGLADTVMAKLQALYIPVPPASFDSVFIPCSYEETSANATSHVRKH